LASGPGGVLQPVQDLVIGEGVEPAAQRVEVRRCLRGLGLSAPGFTRPVHLPRTDTGRRRRTAPDIC
jgi:hypothetical protein